MKRIITILSLSIILISFDHNKANNQNFWAFSLRSKNLISGNREELDKTIVIILDSLKTKDIFSFNLYLCGGNGNKMVTKCSLMSGSNEYITSDESTGEDIYGYIKASRLLSIRDSSKSDSFIFQCQFTGLNKPWQLFRIKLK